MNPYWFIPFLLLTYNPTPAALVTKPVTIPPVVATPQAPSVPKAPNTGAPVANAAQPASPTGYYPKASPSSNYVVPGDTLSFSGSGFAPGEVVTLSLKNKNITSWRANSSGNFTNAGSYNVPFSLEDSSQYFSVVGNTSNYPISINVVVGTFYPTLTPSTYFAPRGSTISALGENYAPGEPVTLFVNGSALGTRMADQRGTVSWSFGLPTSGLETRVEALGLWSNTRASQTVTLAP
ncbi:hypothetical protein KW798_00980 [Candidatus Parcubacteria bacterium]|nr:hypothetical protein [Candidatus Parcubacteria bacterium]